MNRTMWLQNMLKIFSSLKLTVGCLAFAALLVFVGTLDQINLGIYEAQRKYFQSFLVFMEDSDGRKLFPVLPGGYLIGGLLLINLFVVLFTHYKWTGRKSGILMMHVGLIILLLGMLITDLLSRESYMSIDEGGYQDYSESQRDHELVLVNKTDPEFDLVFSVPESLLKAGEFYTNDEVPFKILVHRYAKNSRVQQREDAQISRLERKGLSRFVDFEKWPAAKKVDEKNMPSVSFELIEGTVTKGTWLASAYIKEPQKIAINGGEWEILMRPTRFYHGYKIHLKDFSHDLYAGSDIPKNFSSKVYLEDEINGVEMDTLIYMNHPLRYQGETFYQASFANEDKTSILLVVKNPGAAMPYVACTMMALGMFIQFGLSLWKHLLAKRVAVGVLSS
ncbi:MAG: cytochrome c biogenesis protein ResB [Verrucomicrobiota bacterium]